MQVGHLLQLVMQRHGQHIPGTHTPDWRDVGAIIQQPVEAAAVDPERPGSGVQGHDELPVTAGKHRRVQERTVSSKGRHGQADQDDRDQKAAQARCGSRIKHC